MCLRKAMEASAAVPSDHSWVSDGTALMTGASFIHAIHVRGATVSTWGRSARSRQQAADKCDMWGGGVEVPRNMGDLEQEVWRSCSTRGHRIKRHDAVLDKLLRDLERRGWSILRAPVIPVRGGSPQIPDRGSRSWKVNCTCHLATEHREQTGYNKY